MSPVDALRRAGPYELSEMLGFNGLAATYQGVLASSQQPVVVVALPSEELVKPGSWDDFQKESSILTRTPTASAARLLGHGVEDDVVWAAYEFLRGRHVGSIVQETGLPSPSQAFSVMAFAADALVQLNAMRLHHGAISPASLFLTDMSEFRLLHAAWGRLFHATEKGLVDSRLMSLLPFAAPEVAAGKAPDTASDVYSLGANLYFLLTGLPLHWTENPSDLADLIAKHSVDLNPVRQISGEAADLIEELLEKDPLDRPVNLSALRDRLGALAAATSTNTDAAEGQSAADAELRSNAQRMSLEEFGAVAAAAAAATADVIKGHSHPASPPPPDEPPPPAPTPLASALQHAVASAGPPSEGAPSVPATLGGPRGGHLPVSKPVPVSQMPMTPTAPKPNKALLLIFGAVIVLALAAGGFYVWMGMSEKSPATTTTDRPGRATATPTATATPAGPDRLELTRASLESYAPLLQEFLRRNGVWPRNLADLSGDIAVAEELRTDGWDTTFDVRSNFVVSAGPDKQWDTADDLWIKVDRSSFELGGRTGM